MKKKTLMRLAGLALISCVAGSTILAMPKKGGAKKTRVWTRVKPSDLGKITETTDPTSAPQDQETTVQDIEDFCDGEQKDEDRGDFDRLRIDEDLTPPDEKGESSSVISGVTYVADQTAKPGSIGLGRKPNLFNRSLHEAIEEKYQEDCINKGWAFSSIRKDYEKEAIAHTLLLQAAQNHINDSMGTTQRALLFSGETVEGNPTEYKIPVRAGHVVRNGSKHIRKQLSEIAKKFNEASSEFTAAREKQFKDAKYQATYEAIQATTRLEALQSNIYAQAYDTVYREQLQKQTQAQPTLQAPVVPPVESFQKELKSISTFLVEAAGGVGNIQQQDFQDASEAARLALGLQAELVQDPAAKIITGFICSRALQNKYNKIKNLKKEEQKESKVRTQQAQMIALARKAKNTTTQAKREVLNLHTDLQDFSETTITLRKGSGSTAAAEPILTQLPAGQATVAEALHQINAARYFGNRYNTLYVPTKTLETGLFENYAQDQKEE